MSLRVYWKHIVRWFEENDASYNLEAMQPGADKAAIKELGDTLGVKIPKLLKDLLGANNGGGSFDSYELLGCGRIPQWFEILQTHRENGVPMGKAWVPFAVDSGGNMLCVDQRGMVHWVEAPTREAGAMGLGLDDWLGDYLARLQDGTLAVDDEGFVNEPIPEPAVTGGEKLPALPDDVLENLEPALEADDVDAVMDLLEGAGMGYDVAARYDRSVIGIAAENPGGAVLRALLEAGAAPDAGAGTGERTALYWACWGMNASFDNVALLLEHGADPNAMTSYGGTPIFAAVMWEHEDMIRALVEAGADLDVTDGSGNRPVESTRKPAIVALLTELAGEAG